MFLFGILLLMDFLKVFNQIINLGDIQKLPNDIGRLHISQSKNILFDSTRIIILWIKQVPMQLRYFRQQWFLTILILSKPIGLIIKRPLKKGLNLKRIIFLTQHQDHSLILLITNNQSNNMIISQYNFNFIKWFIVGYKLILDIDYLDVVFICASFIFLVSFLE